MERFRDESCVKGNIKIFMNGKLTMNKRYSRAIGMLQNTGAGSGHMLGQLRPGQHHVTWSQPGTAQLCPSSNIGHQTFSRLSSLQPSSPRGAHNKPSPHPHPHQARGHGCGLGYLLGRWRQNQNLRRPRPRSWARARCRVWRGSAGGHAGAGRGLARAGAGGCRRRRQVQVAGGGAALARPGPGLSEVLGPAEVRQSPHRGRPPARPRLATSLGPAPSPRG